jgi:hypothetical protein
LRVSFAKWDGCCADHTECGCGDEGDGRVTVGDGFLFFSTLD